MGVAGSTVTVVSMVLSSTVVMVRIPLSLSRMGVAVGAGTDADDKVTLALSPTVGQAPPGDLATTLRRVGGDDDDVDRLYSPRSAWGSWERR